MTKLSIIVPVYNVEKYIRPCFESIFKQELSDDVFEIIIVNDGSTDNSMIMIEDIIRQHNNIIVINQDNQGLSVARNKGIKLAKGEYIFMPDSDDLVNENSLFPLLKIAIETKADIIIADFIRITADIKEQFLPIKQKDLIIQEKTGHEIMIENLNPNECYVWRSLFRKDFLIKNNIHFIPGVRFQDVPFTHECYLKAKKCIKASWILNLYRVGRSGAATESFNIKKASEFVTVIANTWELVHTKDIPYDVKQKIQNDVFISFSRFCYLIIYTIDDTNYQVSLIRKLQEKVPDIYFANSIKQKIHSILFRKSPYIYVKFLLTYNWIRKLIH